MHDPHQRIMPFNSAEKYGDPAIDIDLCQSVIAKGTALYLRGQVSEDLDTGAFVAVGDPAGQAEKVMQNIKHVLEASGSCMEHITQVTLHLTDVRHRQLVYPILSKYLKSVRPALTGLTVPQLAHQEYLVEVDVCAVIPD